MSPRCERLSEGRPSSTTRCNTDDASHRFLNYRRDVSRQVYDSNDLPQFERALERRGPRGGHCDEGPLQWTQDFIVRGPSRLPVDVTAA